MHRILVFPDADTGGGVVSTGGTFALYSLLCQHANIGQRPADASYYAHQENQTTRSERHGVANRIRSFLENRKGAQTFLFVVVMMGTCLVIGDGVLTPAISGLLPTLLLLLHFITLLEVLS